MSNDEPNAEIRGGSNCQQAACGGNRPCRLVCGIIMASGCATKRGTGALAGGGVGALIGQAAGRSTEGALIGAAVGTGVGYVIGNELDKKEAKTLEAQSAVPNNAPLAGTTWQVTSLVRDELLPHRSIVLEFRTEGRFITTRTLPTGEVVRDDEACFFDL